MDDGMLKDEISRKLRQSLSNRTLSNDFCTRLKGTALRLRYIRMLKMAIIVTIIGDFSLTMLDYIHAQRDRSPEKAQLVAAKPPQEPNPQLSKLAFLGFFRECFKRVKTTKRKEEE